MVPSYTVIRIYFAIYIWREGHVFALHNKNIFGENIIGLVIYTMLKVW
jgi:hypothetical protein